jgi:deazaflavin-dependent oxidoreductase (nitroreductase family)
MSTITSEEKKSVGLHRGRYTPPRVPRIVRMLNNLTRAFLRLGAPMGPMTLLRVRGRKTGKLHRQPIGFFTKDGRRYLFSTFGETNWVKNIRAARGQVTVGRGRKQEKVTAVELSPEEAAPVIKEAVVPYLANPFASMILGPHMTTPADAPVSEFLKEAERHPVFEVKKRE